MSTEINFVVSKNEILNFSELLLMLLNKRVTEWNFSRVK